MSNVSSTKHQAHYFPIRIYKFKYMQMKYILNKSN